MSATRTGTVTADIEVKRRRRDWTPWLVGGITGIVLVVFLIYPIGKTLLSSFVQQGDAVSFANFTLHNFQRFFTSPLYQQAFLNSLFVSIASTVIDTLLALPAAYGLARIQIPFRHLTMSLSVILLIAHPF